MRTAIPIGLGGSKKISVATDTPFRYSLGVSTTRLGSETSDRIHAERLTGPMPGSQAGPFRYVHDHLPKGT